MCVSSLSFMSVYTHILTGPQNDYKDPVKCLGHIMQVCEHDEGGGLFNGGLVTGSTVGVYFYRVQFITCHPSFFLPLTSFFLFNVLRVRPFLNVSLCCVPLCLLLKEKTKGTDFVFNSLNISVPHYLSFLF